MTLAARGPHVVHYGSSSLSTRSPYRANDLAQIPEQFVLRPVFSLFEQFPYVYLLVLLADWICICCREARELRLVYKC